MGNRSLNRLSALRVKSLQKPGRHADGGGLYLQINEAGNRSWVFRYTRAGRTREMGLGSCSLVSLERARQQAAASRDLLAQLLDPLTARTKAKAAMAAPAIEAPTFRELALECLKRKQLGWRNAKHGKQWLSSLERYAFPTIGKKTAQQVSVNDLLSILEPIWIEKHETATRVRERVEGVLDSAKARGQLTGDNPARWRNHLETLLPTPAEVRLKKGVRHHSALPYVEVGSFVAALRKQQGLAAKALELTILTALRTSEVLGARWEEIDLNLKVWILPGSRMKTGKEHAVPLTAPVCELLEEVRVLEQDGYVFPGLKKGRSLSNKGVR